MNSARPAVTPSPPPGNCRLCVTSKTTGDAEAAHHRKRAHVDDEVVVAEREAALGHEHALVAGRAHLVDRVPHVERRQELALLEVDDPAGLRGRDDEVGLPREERRNLQDVGDLGGLRRLPGLVDVGQDRHADVVARRGRATARPASRPGPRNEVSDVRLALSNDALKM